MTLFDAYGRPIDTRALEREHVDEDDPLIALPTDSIASRLSPVRLANLLQDADCGDPEAFLTLAQEMEERDLHYRGVLFQRRAVISGLRPAVEAVDDSAEEAAIADDVRTLSLEPWFHELVFSAMDAVAKGVSLTELLWETSEKQWRPIGVRWRDQRWYRYGRHVEDIRFQDHTAEGRELPAGKYVRHLPQLKSGEPLRQGLARVAAASHVAKSYTVRDMMRFLETFGIPPRIGWHHANESKERRAKLLRVVRALGTDAAAVIPEGTKIEFLNAPRGTSAAAFLESADWWDRQVSKAVLGQTSSSDGASAGNYKASEQHLGVRMDLARHDSLQVATSIHRDLTRVFVDLNYGPRRRYPRILLPVPVPEDLTKFAAAVTPFVDRGLRVSEREIREKLGLTEPEGEEPLLKARAQGATPPPSDPENQPDSDA